MSARALALATLASALVAITAGSLIRANAVPPPPHYFASDQRAYLSMARQPLVNTDATYPPASWRILPPLVARGLGAVTGGPERGFLLLTFGCFALLPVAAIRFLLNLGITRLTSIACGFLIAVAPTIVGYFSWDVARVDAFSCLLLFCAANATVRRRPAELYLAIVALSLTKETALIGVTFVLAWALAIDGRLRTAAVWCLVSMLALRVYVIPRLVGDPAPFDQLSGLHTAIASLSTRYVLRRLLLSTASTWNVLLPIIALGLVRASRSRLGLVLLATLAVVYAQMIFASDTQRLIAAGYPFVLAAAAIGFDGIAPRWRPIVLIAMVIGQLPWLLDYGRVVRMDGLRAIEIAIVCATGIVVAWSIYRVKPPTTA